MLESKSRCSKAMPHRKLAYRLLARIGLSEDTEPFWLGCPRLCARSRTYLASRGKAVALLVVGRGLCDAAEGRGRQQKSDTRLLRSR